MSQNEVPPVTAQRDSVAERVARQTLARRGEAYADEVRRLLDAGLELIIRCGTASSPRVADIVSAAGLSNDAFYRHFPSKGALVTALLEDGADRLRSYLAHRMAKESEPRLQVRQWVAGVLSQAEPDIAETTLAILWNGGSAGAEQTAGRHFASAPLAALLHEPLTALGSTDPLLHATLAAHATLGRLSDHLWQRTQPSDDEVDRITRWLVAGTGSPARSPRQSRSS